MSAKDCLHEETVRATEKQKLACKSQWRLRAVNPLEIRISRQGATGNGLNQWCNLQAIECLLVVKLNSTSRKADETSAPQSASCNECAVSSGIDQLKIISLDFLLSRDQHPDKDILQTHGLHCQGQRSCHVHATLAGSSQLHISKRQPSLSFPHALLPMCLPTPSCCDIRVLVLHE